MKDYQRDFISFALSHDVLQIGHEYTLKSGRVSPYFFNAGKFNSGSALAKVGSFYAAALVDSGLECDVLFGPAYKGIPLVATTAVSLATKFDKDYPYSFNRKEKKTHGEGGDIVGAKLQGRVVIVDDVITAGTAVRESVEIIKNNGAELVGVLIAVDRQEKGTGVVSAIKQVETELGIPVISIVKLDDIVEYLREFAEHSQTVKLMEKYRLEYGA
ncbi:hypothetical protein HK096_000922 [Nowakowskiella sp. JEL0078]|nr:hypothetical protein HK096_000922 [Nowakowskiella sp. JEL0078]